MAKHQTINFNIITLAFSILLFLSCDNEKIRVKEWSVHHLLYKDQNLLSNYSNSSSIKAIPLYIDIDSKWFLLDLKPPVKAKIANYKRLDEYHFFDINESSDNRFIGEYVYKIDTLQSSKTSAEVRIILESNNVYLKGNHSYFKGL